MQVTEALLVSQYARLLNANHKSPDEIIKLKKEFINYIEGEKLETISNELTEFLMFLDIKEKQKKQGRTI